MGNTPLSDRAGTFFLSNYGTLSLSSNRPLQVQISLLLVGTPRFDKLYDQKSPGCAKNARILQGIRLEPAGSASPLSDNIPGLLQSYAPRLCFLPQPGCPNLIMGNTGSVAESRGLQQIFFRTR